VNPGLFMNREELKERLTDAVDDEVDELLKSLEAKRLVKLYRDGHGTIVLMKASYEGLRKAGPIENYKWFPDWLDKKYIF